MLTKNIPEDDILPWERLETSNQIVDVFPRRAVQTGRPSQRPKFERKQLFEGTLRKYSEPKSSRAAPRINFILKNKHELNEEFQFCLTHLKKSQFMQPETKEFLSISLLTYMDKYRPKTSKHERGETKFQRMLKLRDGVRKSKRKLAVDIPQISPVKIGRRRVYSFQKKLNIEGEHITLKKYI